MHDIFLDFFERAGELRGNPAAYLTRSARNVAVDHVRREKVRGSHATRITAPCLVGDPAFEVLSARQSGDAVRKAIDALPRTTRRIFLMNRVQGFSFHEIARISGMSERNVAKHVAKAVAGCARALEGLRRE